MAIPVIDEFLSFLQTVMDTVPRPVKYLLFFALFIMIGTFILPLLFQATGTLCLHGDKFVGSWYNFPENLIYAYGVLPALNSSTRINGTLDVSNSCVKFVNVSGMPVAYYDGKYCTACDVVALNDTYYYVDSVGNNNIGYCVSDVYAKPYANKSLWQKLYCQHKESMNLLVFTFGYCEPPTNFYYNRALNLYSCLNTTACGNISSYTQIVNDVRESGFNLQPVTSDPIVGIKCFDNTPKLAFAGLDVFNPVAWLLITFIIILFWAYMHFK